jgi:hypothetical protein
MQEVQDFIVSASKGEEATITALVLLFKEERK